MLSFARPGQTADEVFLSRKYEVERAAAAASFFASPMVGSCFCAENSALRMHVERKRSEGASGARLQAWCYVSAVRHHVLTKHTRLASRLPVVGRRKNVLKSRRSPPLPGSLQPPHPPTPQVFVPTSEVRRRSNSI